MASDLSAFGVGLDLAIESLVTPQERRALIQAAADDLLEAARQEIRQAGGRVGEPTLLVNGRPAANLDGIDPDHGTITYRFDDDVIADVVVAVVEMLRANSPVLTGRYRASHRIYADGRDVTDAMPMPAEQAAQVKEFVIQPTVPYARKLERQSGVYEGVAALAQHRFDNAAAIFFEFRSPILPYVAGGANRAERQAIRGQPNRLRAMRTERATRLPCIFITPIRR